MSYVNLHCHTSYSQLDGASKIDEYVARCVELGMPAAAITDHGNLNGLIDFYKECKSQDIKPILGCEFYFADDRLVKEVVKQEETHGQIDGSDKRYYHLSILAANNDGYHNLLKLSSDAYLNGFYYKPRTDYSMLADHSDGIILGTGCLGGPVLQKLLHNDFDGAYEVASTLQEIVGQGNLYVELMDHGLPEQRKTNPYLLDIAKRLGAPACATMDSHYTHKHHAHAHDILLCQPPDTMVEVVETHSRAGLKRGEFIPNSYRQVPIQDIKEGDTVRSWNPINRRGRIRNSGSKVLRTASRHYKDNLVVVNAADKKSRYTKDHICAVRLDSELDAGNYIVYLMEDWNGESFRIGITEYRKTYSNHTLGPIVRCKEEDAKSVWILGIFETSNEARQYEAYYSWKYQIPTWTFGHSIKSAHLPRTPFYNDLWGMVGNLRDNAIRCLDDHDKMIDYPLWSRLETQPSQRTPIFIRACNIESGMLVCVPTEDSYDNDKANTNDGSGSWIRALKSLDFYDGPVYSMDVEQDQTYIADGIVTHNCCQTGAKQSDDKRFRFHNDEYYLKSPEEMRTIFSQNPEVCDNTLLIAEKVDVSIDFDTLHLPYFQPPEEYKDDYDYLEKMVFKYLEEKYPNDQRYYERVAYELSIIRQLNLSSYFLIFWDLVEFTKQERILTGPGRGSAAGSLVSHLLGITKLDPIKYDLLFERFINPDRIALADIDWDTDTRFRDTIIKYTREKYGEDHVAQIITFGKIKARTAVRDAARVMGYDYALGDKISKSMPPLLMGFDTPIKACLELDPKYESGYKNAQGFRELYDSDPDARRVIDAAMGLEGLVRQDGIHAAAVVIGDQPLVNLVPLQKRKDGPIVTAYEKNTIEDLGLLKMDFLGLRNLDVVSDTLKMLDLDFSFLENLDMEDPKVFQSLQNGEGIAVFQVESPQMRDLLRRLKPTSIDDIAAVLALYRPGPMAMNMHFDYADRKNHRQFTTYFHPDAKQVLQYTYGLMIYQEQVMQISQIFAGYTMAEADNLRKIMGKKLPEKMRQEKSKFINGCMTNGYEEDFASELFDSIEGFAAYGFNKSHAYAYAYISYWTAYLKVNYPKEYMAALCSSVMDDLDKSAVYLNEARRIGLQVYPPDLNTSEITYTVENDGIRMGVGGMKNLGEKAADKLLKERNINGRFTSLYDFARRFNPNIQAFKSLAYSGALDEFGSRQGIAAIAEDILKATRKEAKKNSEGQGLLFQDADVSAIEFTIPTTEFHHSELLRKEKETLGIFVSGHPLDDYRPKKDSVTIADIKGIDPQKKPVQILCIIEKVVVKYTKKGDTMAIVTIEDQTGSLETVVFPKSWEQFKDTMKIGSICYFNIRIGTDFKDEKNYVTLGANSLDDNEEINTENFFGIYLPRKFHLDTQYMSLLKGIVLSYNGNVPLRLYTKRNTVLKLSNEYFVEDSQEFRNKVSRLFKSYQLEKGK